MSSEKSDVVSPVISSTCDVDSISSNMSSVMKLICHNLSSSFVVWLMKLAHIFGVNFSTPYINNCRTSSNLNVVLWVLTWFFTTDHDNSIGFDSQWYGGKRRTTLLCSLANSSIIYLSWRGLISFTISSSWNFTFGESITMLFGIRWTITLLFILNTVHTNDIKSTIKNIFSLVTQSSFRRIPRAIGLPYTEMPPTRFIYIDYIVHINIVKNKY